jgi:LAS superfamily LD-carboxypeptidase LdcB
MAAAPGTSNHGWGLAVDFAEELDGDTQPESVSAKFVKWLIRNAATYGFSAEVQSEPWHWRYVAGDKLL